MDASLLPLLEQWHLRLPDDQRRRVQLESCVASTDCRVLVDVNALHLVLDQLLETESCDASESVAITVGIDADDQNSRVKVSGHGLMAFIDWPNQGRSTDGPDLEVPLVRQFVEAWKEEMSCHLSLQMLLPACFLSSRFQGFLCQGCKQLGKLIKQIRLENVIKGN